jgi:putative ABC transport system permease protein
VTPTSLVRESLAYYWRTNLAVVLGVATAVAVLGGALLVGDSVRGSLRDLILRQLGRTDQIIISSGLFREGLADDLRADEGFAKSFADICPLIVMQAGVTDQSGGRRVLHVPVYGVDERFWRFHGVAGSAGSGPVGRDAMVSEALASEIGVAAGSAVLIRVERPTSVPIESLHGRKDDVGRTFRLTVRAILSPGDLGEFSLRPQQGRVRAVFVPLKRLQQELDVEARVNTLLVSEQSTASADAERLEQLVRRTALLEDVGLTVRVVGAEVSSGATSEAALAVESAGGLLDSALSVAAERAAAPMKTQPVFTYLANSLRSGGREIPYSLVTAMDLGRLPVAPNLASSLAARNGRGLQERPADARDAGANPASLPPIVLNDWAARDLGVKPGDALTMEYYVWEEPGRLLTRTASFQVAGVVPIVGAAADRDLAPVYPGITESESLADWDPPFPIDLRRVRQVDEDYWKRYRTTPKAFVSFEVGQELWRSRYGDRTSIRVLSESSQSLTQARDQYAARLRASIDPLTAGLSVQNVRGEGLAASRGATDFGEYFTYFSFFLVLSALLLAALFFRLGIEQRAREVGLLRSVGYTTSRIQRIFSVEGLVLSAIGSMIGVAGAVGYAALMMTGLGSWWSGAVGTDALRLHVSPASLAAGALGAVAAAMACVWWTLRGLAKLSERSLLAGTLTSNQPQGAARAAIRRPMVGALVFGSLGTGLMVATSAGVLGRTGAFFGAGGAFLIACLCLIAFNLRRRTRRPLEGGGWWSVSRLGLRNAADRPGRSVLAIAVIAAATFILISVDAFRRAGVVPTDRQSGVGGYSLIVELLVPLAYDPNGRDGRELIGLDGTAGDDVTIAPFRLLPGDDASCLNLFEPRNPRILGASRTFIDSGRFAFQSSLASSDAEKANPWQLLSQSFGGDGDPVIPVIADANSMTYVLHKELGEDITINRGGQTLRLRLVAALADSIFQSELLMSDANFVKFFSGQDGYRLLLVETAPDRAAGVASAIEEGGRDLGADAVSTTERLAEFHRVENTYISTFQTLGGLGLLVGTVGLAAVLLRNVLERRRELALLGAVGYRAAHVFAIVLAENVLLLGCGLVIGTACAVIAVAPALLDRGGWTPVATEGWILLVAVFTCGLLSSIVATRAALRAPLLGALRSE